MEGSRFHDKENVVKRKLGDPIPPYTDAFARMSGFRGYPINSSHEKYSEKLVSVKEVGIQGDNYYFRTKDNPPYNKQIPGSIPDLLVRESVAKKLARVKSELNSWGLEPYVVDAWRPHSLQQHMYRNEMPRIINAKRAEKRLPPLVDKELDEAVNRYWAKPGEGIAPNPLSPPPHTTGGAVDVVLKNIGGDFVYCGSHFDEFFDATELDLSRTAFFETENYCKNMPLTVRARRTLYNAMVNEGFASNPNEWWHFSYGDQMWAKMTAARAAFYSATAPRT
jgi:zinc D-Ala-D-Ala dipeptidase